MAQQRLRGTNCQSPQIPRDDELGMTLATKQVFFRARKDAERYTPRHPSAGNQGSLALADGRIAGRGEVTVQQDSEMARGEVGGGSQAHLLSLRSWQSLVISDLGFFACPGRLVLDQPDIS